MAMGKTIYIVLTNTGTLLSKTIGMYTKRDLNHASIAFDEQLTEMYSFGRKRRHNPFVGGFVREDTEERFFKVADCAIYSCQVSDEAYERMYRKVCYVERNKEQYKFNFIGLFGVACNKGITRERAYFCSQFVATVVKEGGLDMLPIEPNLVQPHHFTQSAYLTPVYEGGLQTYLGEVRDEQGRIPVPMPLA